MNGFKQTSGQAFQSSGSTNSLHPIYALLANIQIAYARKAPKLVLADARESFCYVSIILKHQYFVQAKMS